MLEKSLNSTASLKKLATWQRVLGLVLWVAMSFGVAQLLLVLLVAGLVAVGVPLKMMNATMIQTVFAAVVYILTLVIVMGVPWWVKKSRTDKKELGLTRLPSWLDIVLAPAGFIMYMLATVIVTGLVTLLFQGFDINQAQETGFSNLSTQKEYYLAFATLVILAPLAEEILFRGYLYGKLRKYIPVWLTMLLVSVLFGVVHGQFNVAVDVFALSIILCTLREITGSIWAGVLLHMLKNAIAYYLLFINPSFLNIMGG